MQDSYIRIRTTKGLKQSFKEAIKPVTMTDAITQFMKNVITRALTHPKSRDDT